MGRQSALKAGDDHSQNDDGDAEGSAAGDLFLQDQNAHDEDPDKTGGGNAGHYGHRHVDQGYLVDHKGGEQKTIGDDDAGIQEFTEEAALFCLCDIGLFFEDDLT